MTSPRGNAQVFIRLNGAPEIVARLNALAEDLQRTAEKAVLRAGAKPILKKSKAIAESIKDTGLLARSMGSNVKMGKDGRRTARIGPRVGFGKEVIRIKSRKERDGLTIVKYQKAFSDPTRYSHLVEYGTPRVPARSFIRAATVNAKEEVLSAMATGLDKYLAKYAARQARKAAMKA